VTGSRRVVLHVGAPKSGTTYLQSRLNRNVDALASHGVLVPHLASGKRPASFVFRAALDVTDVRMNRGLGFSGGYWDRLVDVVGRHDGVAVLSHEAFVRADDDAVARIAAGLGSDAELHVVYTARDLGRSLVSGWVEGLRNGASRPLAAHLERARDGELKLLTSFDLPTVLGRWLAHVPASRVHLVTVPTSAADPELLWQRFCVAAGLDPTWAPEEATRVNESVGVPETQVLLALNAALDGKARRGRRFHDVVRRSVVGAGLAGRDSDRVQLDPAHHDWVAALSEDWLAWVRSSGLDVVGDLADLVPPAVDAAAWVDPAVPHPDVGPAASCVVGDLPAPDDQVIGLVGQPFDRGVDEGREHQQAHEDRHDLGHEGQRHLLHLRQRLEKGDDQAHHQRDRHDRRGGNQHRQEGVRQDLVGVGLVHSPPCPAVRPASA